MSAHLSGAGFTCDMLAWAQKARRTDEDIKNDDDDDNADGDGGELRTAAVNCVLVLLVLLLFLCKTRMPFSQMASLEPPLLFVDVVGLAVVARQNDNAVFAEWKKEKIDSQQSED